MEKRNTILLTIIAIATLLVTIIGATFAYFASSVNLEEGNLPVNVNTTNNTASFIATAGDGISIDVKSYMMQQADSTDGGQTSSDVNIANNLVSESNLNVTLTAADNGAEGNTNVSKCTYDIVWEWNTTESSDFTTSSGDSNPLTAAKAKVENSGNENAKVFPSKYYIRTEIPSGEDQYYSEEFKELTIEADQTISGASSEQNTTSDLFGETNIDQFKCVDENCQKLYLKQGEHLSTTGVAKVDYKFTVKFYNLSHDQSSLAGKKFAANIKVDNVVC